MRDYHSVSSRPKSPPLIRRSTVDGKPYTPATQKTYTKPAPENGQMSQDPTDGLMLPIQQSIPPDVGENAPNSPALAPINTPPEIYASIEQMFEINPDLLAPTSSGMDEMWVTSLRQSSVSSVDSSVAASHGSYNDKFKPSIPVRQRPDTASTAQPGQHLIQRRIICLSILICS